jgi:N-acetylneuraminic acid mutarotase
VSSLRALALGTISAAVVLAGAGCGGSGGSGAGSAHHAAHARRHLATARLAAPRSVKLSYHELYSLPAPVQDPAAADLGAGRFVLLGGLTAADTSSAGVTVADLRGPVRSSTLPGPQHDAQAAALGGKVYVFGGADFNQYDHILSFDPSLNSVGSAGTLPSLASDVAATETGGTAYVVGGFDGSNWLDTIVAWRPGTPARIVAHLPIGLRYAAVTAAGGKVLIIGGTTPSGASDAIFSFDPTSGTAREIGRLPHPITHGGAATLGSTVYLVGGRGDLLDSQSANVWAIDPVTGAVHAAGRLPQPLSDAGVLSSGDAIIVAGGRSPTATQAAVGELLPAGAG